MCEQITINFEIKPHLKKYLIAVYGQEPVCFPYKHNYNRFLVRNIVKPPEDLKITPAAANSVTVVLPKNNLKDITSFNYLSERDKIIFRDEIEYDFWYDVVKFINEKMREENMTRKDATILCMKLYNILETELTYDAIYKHYDRLKKKRVAMFTFSIF